MSLARARTQMLKERDRKIAQIALNDLKRKELDKLDALLNDQIAGIDSALKALDMGEAP